MRNVDATTITDAVLASMAGTADPRLRVLSTALVRHLHAFLREVEPTQEEWAQAIGFLTRVGAMCSATRQEFILLSDTLGASMLVDAINHRLPEQATETTVLGPFYVESAPEYPNGADIAPDLPGEALLVEGRVTDTDGAPIAGAVVDTWQADADGFYDVQRSPAALSGRARLRTDAAGHFAFRSIVPASYPIPHNGPVGEMLRAQGRHPWRPAHVHFRITAPGYTTLGTHLFLAGDRYLDSDAVFGVKDSLIVKLEREAGGPARLRHRFVLAS